MAAAGAAGIPRRQRPRPRPLSRTAARTDRPSRRLHNTVPPSTSHLITSPECHKDRDNTFAISVLQIGYCRSRSKPLYRPCLQRDRIYLLSNKLRAGWYCFDEYCSCRLHCDVLPNKPFGYPEQITVISNKIIDIPKRSNVPYRVR